MLKRAGKTFDSFGFLTGFLQLFPLGFIPKHPFSLRVGMKKSYQKQYQTIDLQPIKP